jgi:hypothetical protein
MPLKKKKQPSWRNSRAQYLLKGDIVNGQVTEDDDPLVVFSSRPEFAPFEAKFPAYLEKLLKSLSEEREIAAVASEALANDKRLHPPANDPRGYPVFQGSEAERLLKEDMDNGLHEQHKPSYLYQQRQEYHAWPLEVFRNHIHQELRTRIEGKYWKDYKKKKRGAKLW